MLSKVRTLTVIGCGKTATTIASLFHRYAVFSLHEILNRSYKSGAAAAECIGSGKAVRSTQELTPVDVILLGVPDSQLEDVVTSLASSAALKPGGILVHLSGAVSSRVFGSLSGHGVLAASVHPVKSFASISHSIETFAGTPCGVEGDGDAVQALVPCFERIGGKCFLLNESNKLLYHAAAVFSCNYLTVLLDLGIRALKESGVSAELAEDVLRPLLDETIENTFRLGAPAALTGPVARLDAELVCKQFSAVNDWNGDAGGVYGELAFAASDLLERREGRLESSGEASSAEEIERFRKRITECISRTKDTEQ